MALFVLPAFAQLGKNKDGYYRVRNSQYPTDYISIANNKFNYQKIIGSVSSVTDATKPYKINFAEAYLRNDAHIIQDTEFISAQSLIYIFAEANTANNKNYNLIAQGTSLRTIATGSFYVGNAGQVGFDKWVQVEKVSGDGVDTKYRASVRLRNDTGYGTGDLGTLYFYDDTETYGKSTFRVCEVGSITEAAYWYLEPVTYFNVVPEIEYNGKYYTTLKVPFQWQIAEGSSVEKIYVITDATNGILQQQEITGIVPEGTPVILECASSNPLDCKLNPIGVPKYSLPSIDNQEPPEADEASYYSGVNILYGTYYCNTDGKVTYISNANGGTGSIDGNHYTAPTNPQKYVLGFSESGQFGFKTATQNIPANTVWMEEQAEFAPNITLPVFSPIGGSYDHNPLSVSLTCATPGAVIRYTTNGTTPTINSPVYSGPIAVNKNMTIKAIAISGSSMSTIASQTYTLKVSKPIITLDGTSATKTATITCSTEGATIRYTTDGSNPTASSTEYTGSFTVDNGVTIKARAFKDGLTVSDIATVTYSYASGSSAAAVMIASPELLNLKEGNTGTINVYGYNLSKAGLLGSNTVALTNSNSSFTATPSVTTGSVSSGNFNPRNGSLTGKISITYTGRELKDNSTIKLVYRGTNLTKTAKATYEPDIYIITDNGQNQWNYNGAQMNNINGVYTATFTAPADNTYIIFSRKANLASNEQWGTRYIFGPSGSGNWIMPSNVERAGGAIDVNEDNPIKLPYAGEYTITINTNISYYPFSIYREMETVATPTFSPGTSSFVGSTSVTIESTTPGATIYYTTDGSTPTLSSTPYNGSITVNETTTIKAIAVKEGWHDSEVATATYTVLQPELTVDKESLTINDNGNYSFYVTGSNLTDNVGVTRSTTDSKFIPSLSATIGTTTNNNTTYDNGPYWYFTPSNHEVSGQVSVTYDGRPLRASEDLVVATKNAVGTTFSQTVHVDYKSDIFIVGDNGNGNWNYSSGTQMNDLDDDGIYTATITVPANTCILFARKTGVTYTWDYDYNRLFVGAETNGSNWQYNGNDHVGNLEFDPRDHNHIKYCPIQFPSAGTYMITVNANNNTFTINGVTAATLAVIESTGIVGNNYAVSDELIGAWYVEYTDGQTIHPLLFAKDQGNANVKTYINTTINQMDYVKDILGWQDNDWDQSNWVVLDFVNIANGATIAQNLVDHKITPNTIVGTYDDNSNYRIVLQGSAPTASSSQLNQYPGYMGAVDGMNPYGGSYANTYYNTYVTPNFLLSNTNVGDNTGFVATEGPHAGDHLFFMNPKLMEVALVYGVWAGNDKFTVYLPNYGEDGVTTSSAVNAWGIKGAVQAYWDYNRRADSGTSEDWGKPTSLGNDVTSHVNDAYFFHAVVAPKRANTLKSSQGTADSSSPVSDSYGIYPLDMPNTAGNWTAVHEVKGDNRMIESVTYYNVMGKQSSKPFEGINIVVTRYSDGSTSAIKVLR